MSRRRFSQRGEDPRCEEYEYDDEDDGLLSDEDDGYESPPTSALPRASSSGLRELLSLQTLPSLATLRSRNSLSLGWRGRRAREDELQRPSDDDDDDVSSRTPFPRQLVDGQPQIPIVNSTDFRKGELSSKPVGAGCQAIVFAYRPRSSDSKFALKMLKTSHLHRPSQRLCFEREIQILGRLAHPNVLGLLSRGATPGGVPHCVLEWVDMDLRGALCLKHVGRDREVRETVRERYPNALRVHLMRQLASALDFLHSTGLGSEAFVIHRDLKPDNVGLVGRRVVKLLDFGLAVAVPRNQDKLNQAFKMTGCTGSLRYMAPECARHQAYGSKVDVFSFALVCWEVLSLQGKPFEGMSPDDHWAHVVHGKQRPIVPKSWPRTLRKLIKRGWDTAAHNRPDMRSLKAALDSLPHRTDLEEDPLQRNKASFSARRALASVLGRFRASKSRREPRKSLYFNPGKKLLSSSRPTEAVPSAMGARGDSKAKVADDDTQRTATDDDDDDDDDLEDDGAWVEGCKPVVPAAAPAPATTLRR